MCKKLSVNLYVIAYMCPVGHIYQSNSRYIYIYIYIAWYVLICCQLSPFYNCIPEIVSLDSEIVWVYPSLSLHSHSIPADWQILTCHAKT